MKDKLSFAHMRSAFFAFLIVGLGLALLYLFLPFLYPIFWAGILAVLFYPTYQALNRRIKNDSLSAFFVEILIVLVILLPLTFVIALLVNQSLELYQVVTKGQFFSSAGALADRLKDTVLGPYIAQAQAQWGEYTSEAAKNISLFLFNELKNITTNSVRLGFYLFLMMYTLYYFFKDGPRMLSRLVHLSPLGDQYEAMLSERVAATVRATLKGSLIIGMVQGAIGAVLFWATGVPGAFVWGVLMTAASLIPGIGAFLVWLPVGIVMIVLGNVWQGVTILVVGALIISLVDNLMRPILVGKGTKMHSLVVLFSTLGGIAAFGLSGVVIGPVIAALFLSVVSMYDHYYRSELGNN